MNLRWNTSDYGGVKDLRIPPHRIWKPDVLMYNSADEGFDGTYQTNVVVRNNGSCLYVPPGIFKSTCKIDITWFPFDDQRCEMKFGSWTYDGFQVWISCQQLNTLTSIHTHTHTLTHLTVNKWHYVQTNYNDKWSVQSDWILLQRYSKAKCHYSTTFTHTHTYISIKVPSAL